MPFTFRNSWFWSASLNTKMKFEISFKSKTFKYNSYKTSWKLYQVRLVSSGAENECCYRGNHRRAGHSGCTDCCSEARCSRCPRSRCCRCCRPSRGPWSSPRSGWCHARSPTEADGRRGGGPSPPRDPGGSSRVSQGWWRRWASPQGWGASTDTSAHTGDPGSS